MRRRVVVVAALGCLGVATAVAAEFALVGGYGFDWLKPKQARCARITPADAARFKACTFAASGAFGLELAYHSCPLQRGGEMIVLQSKAACQQALETMQANAP